MQPVVEDRQHDVVEMVSQDQLLVELDDLGYDISARTLTSWRTQGLIPPLVRVSNSYWCPRLTTLEAAMLSASSNGHLNNGFRFGKQPERLFTHRVEGESFDIIRIEIVRVSGTSHLILHTSGDEFFLLRISQEELDALTSSY